MTKIDPPAEQSTRAKALEATIRSALAMIPFVGGASVELFQAVVNSGRDARMQRWIVDVTDAINERALEPNGLDLASLATNDGFLDVIGAATRAAVETSDAEKIAALRNAVVNATVAPDTERDRHAILLDILTGLTPTHIKLLRLFDDPLRWYRETDTQPREFSAGSSSVVVQDAYPDLARDPTLLDRVVADLKQSGLSDIQLSTMMTNSGIYAPRTLPLGTELLAFITTPEA